jgi:DNA-binding CsgD family transcriptional regulator
VKPLSKRELEVLRLVAAGKNSEQIASILFLSPSTVRTHIVNVLGKLDAHNRVEAVAVARRRGLMEETEMMSPLALAILSLIMAHPEAYAEVLASEFLNGDSS